MPCRVHKGVRAHRDRSQARLLAPPADRSAGVAAVFVAAGLLIGNGESDGEPQAAATVV